MEMETIPSVEQNEPAVIQAVPPEPVKANKKFRLFVGLIFGMVILAAAAAVSAAVYLLPTGDKFVRTVTSVAPYPIAVVNMQPIFFKDFYRERAALDHFYEANGTAVEDRASEAELDDSIIETMIDREITRQLAARYVLSLDSAKVDEVYTDASTSNQTSEEDFLVEIDRLFGWKKDDFLTHVVHPVVLASQVEEAVSLDESMQAEARAKIDAALVRIKNNEDFSAVATEVSEDQSASEGGDLGFLTVDQLPPEWLDPITAGELNKPTEVINLGQVFSIAMPVDKVEGEDGTQYKIKVIIVYKVGMDEVVQNFTDASKIWKFLKT